MPEIAYWGGQIGGFLDGQAERDAGEDRSLAFAQSQGPRGLRASLPVAARAAQAMAARTERRRDRYVLPVERRGARADYAVAGSRGHPWRYRSRRLLRRNGGDRRPAAVGRYPRHHRG